MVGFTAYESGKHEDRPLHDVPVNRDEAKAKAREHTEKTKEPTRVKGPCGGHPNTCVWESSWEKDRK